MYGMGFDGDDDALEVLAAAAGAPVAINSSARERENFSLYMDTYCTVMQTALVGMYAHLAPTWYSIFVRQPSTQPR